MMFRISIVAAACLVALACKPDPAKSVKIKSAPTAPPAEQAVLPPWNPANCAFPPEDSAGKSRLDVTGPCAFHHEGNVKCKAGIDDFYAIVFRELGKASAAIYINVEAYHGNGDYKNAQMFLTYQNGQSYYHWSSDSVSMRVTNGERALVIPETHLEAEPPNTGTEAVKGTLSCAVVEKTKQ